MKRIIAVASVLFILAAFAGCSRKTTDDLNSAVSDVKSDIESAMSGDGTGSENVSSMSNGKYTVKSEEYDESGYLATVTVTVSDGKVVSVGIDDIDKDRKSKKALSESGNYGMKEKGNAKAEWHEEIAVLEKHLIEKGVKGITVDSEGKTDAISGCTISISQYLNLYNKAIEKAKA